jgi:hypothetical protein
LHTTGYILSVSAGHNHWIKTNLEKGVKEKFSISFNIKHPIKNLNFQDSADYTAKLIASKYTNLHLGLSGGLDSEFVAKVLLRNDIPFVPVIIITLTGESEVLYATKFCQENNLRPLIFDFRDYYKHQHLLKKTLDKSIKLQTFPNLGLINNILPTLVPDAHFITGDGEIGTGQTIWDYDMQIGDDIEMYAQDFYLNLECGDIHPGPFFSYTPELFLSMAKEIDPTKNNQSAKSSLYDLLFRTKSRNYFLDLQAENELGNLLKLQYNRMFYDTVLNLNRTKLINELEQYRQQ